MKISRSLFASVIPPTLFVLAACAPAAPPSSVPPAAITAPTTAPAAVATTASSAATAAPTAASALAGDPTSVIKLARVANFGLFLTDGADRTLYAFDNDKKDTSTCAGNCLQNWPPFIVRALPQAAPAGQATIGVNAALISIFTRSDGASQGEFDSHPLYYFSGDKNPGDYNGHGVGNLWHVLSPRGSPMLNAAPPTATKSP